MTSLPLIPADPTGCACSNAIPVSPSVVRPPPEWRIVSRFR